MPIASQHNRRRNWHSRGESYLILAKWANWRTESKRPVNWEDNERWRLGHAIPTNEAEETVDTQRERETEDARVRHKRGHVRSEWVRQSSEWGQTSSTEVTLTNLLQCGLRLTNPNYHILLTHKCEANTNLSCFVLGFVRVCSTCMQWCLLSSGKFDDLVNKLIKYLS